MMIRRHKRMAVQKAAVLNDNSETCNHEDSEKTYSKTEINRMAKADLLDLAAANGIEADEYTSGTVLKEILIDKLVKQV